MAEKTSKTYYIVNPSGTVHGVTREHAARLLLKTGYRMATKLEVEKLAKAKGMQTLKARVAPAWNPTPDAETELPGDEGETTTEKQPAKAK